jgi:hypothetical protein
LNETFGEVYVEHRRLKGTMRLFAILILPLGEKSFGKGNFKALILSVGETATDRIKKL